MASTLELAQIQGSPFTSRQKCHEWRWHICEIIAYLIKELAVIPQELNWVWLVAQMNIANFGTRCILILSELFGLLQRIIVIFRRCPRATQSASMCTKKPCGYLRQRSKTNTKDQSVIGVCIKSWLVQLNTGTSWFQWIMFEGTNVEGKMHDEHHDISRSGFCSLRICDSWTSQVTKPRILLIQACPASWPWPGLPLPCLKLAIRAAQRGLGRSWKSGKLLWFTEMKLWYCWIRLNPLGTDQTSLRDEADWLMQTIQSRFEHSHGFFELYTKCTKTGASVARIFSTEFPAWTTWRCLSFSLTCGTMMNHQWAAE